MVQIKQSVGQGGRNLFEDVLCVQILLNKFIAPGVLGVPLLVLDGKSGPNTIQAIKAFQALFLGFRKPDGRVDPDPARGKTITALNGPLMQPKHGDPHDTAVQSVVSTLRESAVQCLDFRMSSYRLAPIDYRKLADLFAWRRLQVYYISAKGDNAEYVHGNTSSSGGDMIVGFPTARTAWQKSIIVHEATHAICDGWRQVMGTVQAESLAHLAQAVYCYHLTGRHFSMAFGPTADILTTAVNIAIRMRNTGNRNVLPPEVSELYGRALKLTRPGRVLVYDGH